MLSSSNHSFSALSLLKWKDLLLVLLLLLVVLGSLRACLLTFITSICEIEGVFSVYVVQLDRVVVIAAVVSLVHLVEYHERMLVVMVMVHAILPPIVYIFLEGHATTPAACLINDVDKVISGVAVDFFN